jgi:hypothetical protein
VLAEASVVAGSGDEIPARTGGLGHLRASNADREHVIAALKAAYVHGLVTKDEFDARVSQTFSARTYAELAPITADIPAGLAAASSAPSVPGAAPARNRAPAGANLKPGDRAIIATAIFAGLAWVAAVFATPDAALPALAGVGSASVSLSLVAAQMRGSQRGKRTGSQLPPQGGISTGQRSGRRTPAEQLPDASKPRRHSKADGGRSRSPRPQLSC